MRILEAYYDLTLRTGLKKYLLAEGKKLSEIDRLYRQFGTYLSRLKGIAFYQELLVCSSESAFRDKLDYLFGVLWEGHMEYVDMPVYFSRYLDYLHSASALDPTLEIDGLEPPADIWCIPGSSVTEYAEPYVNKGKLMIIANPLLIKKLLPFRDSWSLESDEALRIVKKFYGNLLPDMTDLDWKLRIEELLCPKKIRKAKATARNVEFTFKDASKKIMSGNQAMEFVIRDTGVNRFLTLNVKHKGDKIVTRSVDSRYETYYKQLEDGLWLNLKGSVAEKVKTMRLLTSLLKLPYSIMLTNETPDC